MTHQHAYEFRSPTTVINAFRRVAKLRCVGCTRTQNRAIERCKTCDPLLRNFAGAVGRVPCDECDGYGYTEAARVASCCCDDRKMAARCVGCQDAHGGIHVCREPAYETEEERRQQDAIATQPPTPTARAMTQQERYRVGSLE